MSSVSSLPAPAAKAHVDRIFATIPSATNRGTVASYRRERRVNGIRESTLCCDANALRGFCRFLVEKPPMRDFLMENAADVLKKWMRASVDAAF